MPLEEYKENLKRLVQHPAIKEHNPKIIIINPPPINEYQLPVPERIASITKSYADAARETATSLGVPIADIWTRFMKMAGWSEGQALLGSRDIPNNEKLQSFFIDGLSILYICIIGSYRTSYLV